ncbi:hypothetical protein SprV_0702248300 [Sparganum proliferum]
MRHSLVAVLSCILLGASASVFEVERGFPETCGIPVVERENKEEAERRKTRATPNSWSWHVGLWSDRRGEHPFCGGTLISRSLVVTAAHCIGAIVGCNELPLGRPFSIPATSGDRLQILVGAHDYTKDGTSDRLHLVQYVVVHPQYNHTLHEEGYDIALLKLYEDARPGETVQPICFPSSSVTLPRGTICYFAGWGGLYKRRSPNTLVFPKTLREAQVQIELDAACVEVFTPYYSNRHSCIRTEGTNPCVGDSGGGLFCHSHNDGDNRWFWYGVIESGTNDCRGDCAIVSNVKTIHKWVKDTALVLRL